MSRKPRGNTAGTPAAAPAAPAANTAPAAQQAAAEVVETTEQASAPATQEQVSNEPTGGTTPDASTDSDEPTGNDSQPSPEAPSLSEAEIKAVAETAVQTEAALTAIVETAVKTAHADVAPIVATLLTAFDGYMEVMDSTTQPDEETGVALQRRLYRTLTSIFTLEEGKDFIAAMNYVVARIRESRGPRRAFNENWVFRFYQLNPLSPRDKAAAELLIMFTIGLADGFAKAQLTAAIKTLTVKRLLADQFVSRLAAYGARTAK